jgi:hypothetical protein
MCGERWFCSINVRFGSKADMCTAMGHVRFTPLATLIAYFHEGGPLPVAKSRATKARHGGISGFEKA